MDGVEKRGCNNEVQISGEVNRMIQTEVRTIYDRLETLRQKSKFPSFDTVNIPMVLVLGNHSSGKSTFINYMLGQEVQKTGRAPTDCTFTVIMGGNRAERLDGSALTRHAKYGFGDIQRLFGRELVSQIELKVIEKSALLDEGGLMLVDSPGMIDPPGASPDRTDTDRGYDFKRVVHWFADRADVILVMFDPDKPGTTFETLDVLTTSLRQMSSKVLLILNKVDDFRTVHDFARAYGALCWNLSKVIPRKDLPFIYTMYVPQNERKSIPSQKTLAQSPMQDEKKPKTNSNNETEAVLLSGLTQVNNNVGEGVQQMLEEEFNGTRGEVIREVQRAPDRATDNILNLLKSTASRLKMHVTMIEACKQEYTDMELFWKRVQYAGIALGVGAAAWYLIRTVGQTPIISTKDTIPSISSTEMNSSAESNVSSSPTSNPRLRGAQSAGDAHSSSTAKHAWKQSWAQQVARAHAPFRWSKLFKIIITSVAGNMVIWKTSFLRLEQKRQTILQWLPNTFERVYAHYLCASDRTHDDLLAQWHLVQPGLELALASSSIEQFEPFTTTEKSYLDDLLSFHIPRLDRCVRDRTGDDHAYLRFKHLEKPSMKTNA